MVSLSRQREFAAIGTPPAGGLISSAPQEVGRALRGRPVPGLVTIRCWRALHSGILQRSRREA
jgi:hypothetical protein